MDDLNALPLPALFEELVANDGLEDVLDFAFDEDAGATGDLTTTSIIDSSRRVTAVLRSREEAILAGLRLVPELIGTVGALREIRFEARFEDGARCEAGAEIGRFDAALAPLLLLERTMLNFLGHLSGIATLTGRFVEAVAGTRATICDTRKTTPGLRRLEKYAVRCGGGVLHRLGLFDAALYKDNHLAHIRPEELAGKLAAAIGRARGENELRFVEVEVDSLDQLERVLAIEAGLIDMVLLDNMSTDDLRAAVAKRDSSRPDVLLEASGGVTLETVRGIAESGVDRISVGAITHSAPSIDMTLEVTGDEGAADG